MAQEEDFCLFVDSVLFLSDNHSAFRPFDILDDDATEETPNKQKSPKTTGADAKRTGKITKRPRLKQGMACWAHQKRHQRCTRDWRCLESALRSHGKPLTKEEKKQLEEQRADLNKLIPLLLQRT